MEHFDGSNAMMTKSEIASDVTAIRAREHRADVMDPRPVVGKWKVTPPFAAKPNQHAELKSSPAQADCTRQRALAAATC
jgi:hypothetical protein